MLMSLQRLAINPWRLDPVRATLNVGSTIIRPMCAVHSAMAVARAIRTTTRLNMRAATTAVSRACIKV